MAGDPSLLIGSIAVVAATLFVKTAEGKHGECPQYQHWDYHQQRCVPDECPTCPPPPPPPPCRCPPCTSPDENGTGCVWNELTCLSAPTAFGYTAPPGSISRTQVRELV